MFDLVVVGTSAAAIDLAREAVRRNLWVALIGDDGQDLLLKHFRRIGGEAFAGPVRFVGRFAVELANGRTIRGRRFLLAGRPNRLAFDAHWLDALQLPADERGAIWCDKSGRTWQSHVFACGPIAGFPRCLDLDRLRANLLPVTTIGTPSPELAAV